MDQGNIPDSNTIYSSYEEHPRTKREPVSLTLAILLGGVTMGGIAAGVGTGTVALQRTNEFLHLQAAMSADLTAMEEAHKCPRKVPNFPFGGSAPKQKGP